MECIFLVDGSWTSTSLYRGCGWTWIEGDGQTQLSGTKIIRQRESPLQMELEALQWTMDNMLHHSTCQYFGTDWKDVIAMVGDPESWPSFSTELKEIQDSKSIFQDFKIIYIPNRHNESAYHLAKTTRSFLRDIFFVGYSISVWLSRLSKVWVIGPPKFWVIEWPTPSQVWVI